MFDMNHDELMLKRLQYALWQCITYEYNAAADSIRKDIAKLEARIAGKHQPVSDESN